MGGSLSAKMPQLLIDASVKATLADLIEEIGFAFVDHRINLDTIDCEASGVPFTAEFHDLLEVPSVYQVTETEGRHLATLRDILLFTQELILQCETDVLEKLHVVIYALGSEVRIGSVIHLPKVEIDRGVFRLELVFMYEEKFSARDVYMKRGDPAAA